MTLLNSVIVLMGYFYADDYPNKKVYDVYSSISIGSDADLQIDDEDFKEFSPQKNSPSPLERRRQRNKGSFQPLLANDDLAKDRIRPIRKSHSFAPSNTERKEIYLISDNIEDAEIIRPSNLVRASSQPAQINLNEDVQNIEDIQIVTFEEIMRNDKLTALYVIVYHIKGQKFVTKRSYSEFDNLYKEIKRFDKNAPLPPMPSKKVLSSKTEGVKVDRIEVFDKILKILVTKKIGLKCLSEFLQTPDRLSFYGRLVPSRKSKSSPGEDVLQTPVLNRISDKPGGNEGINKYRVTGGKILKGTDNMINYQIKIIENESQSEITIIKRHKEFREFHGQLTENSDKRFKSQIPNLPDKLKVGPSSEDPKAIIEYRRAMLPRYLQTILNNPVLNGNPAILEFLKDAK